MDDFHVNWPARLLTMGHTLLTACLTVQGPWGLGPASWETNSCSKEFYSDNKANRPF